MGVRLFPTFRSFRRQLVWSFLLTIALMGALSVTMVFSMLHFFLETDRLLHTPTHLARTNHHLNEVHQYITNFVNYDDQRFISSFYTGLAALEDQYHEYAPIAREISRNRVDVEFYYNYLEIGNMFRWYRENSDTLITAAMAGQEERFYRFDRLYQLRDLKNRISADLSELVFRQMMHVQNLYDAYRDRLWRQWIILSVAFILTVAGLILWAAYQARTISAPIQHLIVQGRKIAENDFAVVEAPDVRNEELQALNRTFISMAAGIARTMDLLSQKTELERKNLEMSQSIKQAELELLQSQINPHFLFNTLNTICSLAQIEDARETGRLLGSLSTFLRYNLKHMHTVNAVHREIEMIEHYLYIQKQRFGSRLEYSVHLQEEARLLRIPSLTIQPLVENALIHGVEPIKNGGSVTVSVTTGTRKDLLIRVEDTGRGMTTSTIAHALAAADEEAPPRDHMGLANTLRRLRLYDPTAEIEIQSQPGSGTVLSIAVDSTIDDRAAGETVHHMQDARESEIATAGNSAILTG